MFIKFFKAARILPIIAAVSFLTAPAFSYIPSTDFILSKAVKNAGQGVYAIKQEVSFPTAERNITVTESWWVQNDDLLFLKVEGPLFTQYYLYKNGKKYFFNSQGTFVSSAISSDFFQNLFFKRTSDELKAALLNKKIMPSQALKKRPIFKTNKDLQALNEPYLKLSRLRGTITYVLGFAAQDENTPGIWIEQDKFLIKKIKFPDAEFSADTFSELSKNLVYPKTQRISWGNSSAQIELARGDSLAKGVEFFDENQFAKLANQNKPLPSDLAQSAVAEFYKRFR